jgi:CheY-like chemotaxis protein/tRNA A-37 threonylcarbamoyl transferase component Bud32
MSDILVIDDEAPIRLNLQLMLRKEGHSVRVAENGKAGLREIQRQRPALVVCDVMMPELDGFGLLEAVRADPGNADLPFIFLTALDTRASMRRGMNLGADDYLNKPFTREELLEAVGIRLKKQEQAEAALETRVLSLQEDLKRRFQQERNRRGEPITGPMMEAAADATGKLEIATLLFSDIRNFTTISERLTVAQAAELLSAYFERACAPIVGNHGRILKLLGDGVMAVFEPGRGENHAKQAIQAALGISLAAFRFRDWIRERYGDHALPEFAVGVGLHTGEIIECRIGMPGHESWTAIGDSVNVASRLEGQTKAMGWPVIASRATVDAAGADVVTGRSTHLELRGRNAAVEAIEITGLAGGNVEGESGLELAASIREALAANAQNAARVSKAILSETLRMITADLDAARREMKPQSILGYRILSKIGEGGMSEVYLADRESDAQQVVLKIMNARPDDDPELFQRFLQEYNIISSVQHNNVVRIYDHGFSETCAYIAMEYLSRGTLKDAMREGLSRRQALSLLAQIAGGLAAIHERGIIHRDLKPANIMVRDDGTIAIADFGIAKKLEEASENTRYGQLFGTPYYVAPELIEGVPASPRSDLYSLGIVFHELVTGRRPFEAPAISELIAQHLRAPIPRLPKECEDFQPLVDGLLAKDPAERFPSAEALLAAIDRVWTQQSLRAFSGDGQ